MQTVKHISTHPNVAAELARRDIEWAKGAWFLALRNGGISLADYRREIAQLEQLERKGEAA